MFIFSGGEGCAIASGAAVVGVGSDIGGSIRMPSFFNGIFGHKPSNGKLDSYFYCKTLVPVVASLQSLAFVGSTVSRSPYLSIDISPSFSLYSLSHFSFFFSFVLSFPPFSPLIILCVFHYHLILR